MWGRAKLVVWGAIAALGCGDAARFEGPPGVEGRETTLVLLHTSDLHSRVWPFRERISAFEAALGLGQAGALEELGGFARLASVLERELQSGAALWLDSGDALEGAEVFRRFGGELEVELLGALGLSAMALGNHELSLSAPALAALLGRATFPVLAADLEAGVGSPLAGRVGSSVVLTTPGMKVGVVGVANPSSPPNLASAGNPWGLRLAADLAAAVQLAIDEMAPSAGLIVVLSHLGLDGDRELVRATSGVDLVLGGHQHVVTQQPEWQQDCTLLGIRERRGCVSRAVPIVHSAAYGKLVSRIELALTRSDGAQRAWDVERLVLSQLPVSSSVPGQPDVLQRLEQLRPPPEPPLGFVPEPLLRYSALGGDSALGNLLADALGAASGADVVLLNSASLRGDLEVGPLLEPDLELVLPFAEPWFTLRLAGRALEQGLLRAARRSASRDCASVLQVSGLKLRVECTACREARPDCLRVLRVGPQGDRPLADDEIVTVSLPAYLTLDGADFEGSRASGSELSMSALEALARHIAQLPSGAAAPTCVESLARLSSDRCQQAFGVVACPVDPLRAATWCRTWPWLVRGRDERIQMLP